MAKKKDPAIAKHEEWLGYVEDVGLVVAPAALARSGSEVLTDSRTLAEMQLHVRELLEEREHPTTQEPVAVISDFFAFAERVLEWKVDRVAGAPGGPEVPEELTHYLPEYGETLAPDLVVFERGKDPQPALLVRLLETGTPMDRAVSGAESGWTASPQASFERLLKEVKVPAGILWNGTHLRLVSAPVGESSGHLTWPLSGLAEVPGREMLAGLHLLVRWHTLVKARTGRLGELLAESRKYQNEVSTQLAGQVLGALHELLRGFEAADRLEGGRLLGELAQREPHVVYGGLLTTLMRLVFLLYAEDEGLLSDDPIFRENYSVTGLFARLRDAESLSPDGMDQRFGAWAWLVSLFNLIHDGGRHTSEGGHVELPPRHGQLFDPEQYPFLEGRRPGDSRDVPPPRPRVSDGCIYRCLRNLLVLDGERLSYRALDVEQVGSVYEAMMGFELERAAGPSIGVRRRKKGMDTDVVIDLDELLAQPAGKRGKWLEDATDKKLSGKSAAALKEAETHADVLAALGRALSPYTPNVLPAGSLYLQPGEERRRTGSHYTPRELTQPIVETTLRPVLENLVLENGGEHPKPEQILALKVCDPAMGSGAFLVEACRQLAEHLEAAWRFHGTMPELPPAEDPLAHARRLVAQSCLYGVDKNPFAVSLAKLSLWLITLAKDQAFTFLDHSLKHGDSLVGLTREQIAAFHWEPKKSDGQLDWVEERLKQDLEKALGWRDQVESGAQATYDEKQALWSRAEGELETVRLIGDLCIAAFFGAGRKKGREELRAKYRDLIEEWQATGEDSEIRRIVAERRGGERPVVPFHWEVEFPEVFGMEKPGFNVVVGNPPFLGGTRISGSTSQEYLAWLKSTFAAAGNRMDLVAYFLRLACVLVRKGAAVGLIATNTVAQGDTRSGGLAHICARGGKIFTARRRVHWPGRAAVVVSVLHLSKGLRHKSIQLDGRQVGKITAFLLPGGSDTDPARLAANDGASFEGFKPGGQGFIFDDQDERSTPCSVMNRILAESPESKSLVREYIGGKELNSSPTLRPERFAIDFGRMGLGEAERHERLIGIVREKVKPYRDTVRREAHRKRWWQYAETRPGLVAALAKVKSAVVVAQTSNTLAFAIQPADRLFAHTIIVFPCESEQFFAVMQSRLHTSWALVFAAKMKDDARYLPSDCFATFPFPEGWTSSPSLEAAGKVYYDYRAQLMIDHDEGLTKTYNRFHDPDEQSPAIHELRRLHAEMDRAVLDAYGWSDISTDCEFLLDYEIDEEEWGKKKKPWRYRWPDEVHDEVLARLLDLNQKRHEEEVAAGIAPGMKKKKAKKASKKKASKNANGQTPLFEGLDGQEGTE